MALRRHPPCMKKASPQSLRACLFFNFYRFTFLPFYFFTFLKHYRSVAHARRSRNGRQKCCERGYYNLYRNLNKSVRLHTLILFDV
jgi:hypothetical protein